MRGTVVLSYKVPCSSATLPLVTVEGLPLLALYVRLDSEEEAGEFWAMLENLQIYSILCTCTNLLWCLLSRFFRPTKGSGTGNTGCSFKSRPNGPFPLAQKKFSSSRLDYKGLWFEDAPSRAAPVSQHTLLARVETQITGAKTPHGSAKRPESNKIRGVRGLRARSTYPRQPNNHQ